MAEILLAIAAGIPWTLALTASSFALGAVLGVALCALRLSRLGLLRLLGAAIILTLRSIPPIVWLFVICFGLGADTMAAGPFAAAAAGLGLIGAANMAEIYRGALSAVDAGQWEAAIVLDLPPLSRFVDVIGPQMLRTALPAAATLAIGLLKDSAVASTIGVTEIAFATDHVSQRTSHGLGVFAIAGALYLAISLPIAVAARWADLRLRVAVAR